MPFNKSQLQIKTRLNVKVANLVFISLIAIPVYKVSIKGVSPVMAGTLNMQDVDVVVHVHDNGQAVSGRFLWQIEMWASANPDGSGRKIGYDDKVRHNVGQIIL